MLFSFNHHLHQDYLFFYKETFEGVSLVLKEFNDGLGGGKTNEKSGTKNPEDRDIAVQPEDCISMILQLPGQPPPPTPMGDHL